MSDKLTLTPVLIAASESATEAGDSRRKGVDGGEGGEKKRGVLARLLSVLMFIDLPIRRKFTLFALGTGFWFFFMALVGVAAMTAIHYNYHQVSENAVPYRQTIATVLARLHDLERDLDMVVDAGESAAGVGKESAREHARGIREALASLSLSQSEGRQSGTIVEQILQAMAKSNPEGVGYLQEMVDISNRLDRTLEEFFLAKSSAAESAGSGGGSLPEVHAALDGQIGAALELSRAYAERIESEYKATDRRIYQIIRNSVHIILLVLVVAMTLLLLFVRNIIQAFDHPIASIIGQIESLGSGDVERAKKIQVRSKDEIGSLSRKFNSLIDSVHGMTIYKKVIEEDSTLDEVYRRLGEVFTDRLGIDDYTIYEVNMGKKEMRVGYPPQVGDNLALHCQEDILSDCTLCRAVKTGRNISSFEYRGICRQFIPEEGKVHVCVPMLLSGNTGGVVRGFRFQGEWPSGFGYYPASL